MLHAFPPPPKEGTRTVCWWHMPVQGTERGGIQLVAEHCTQRQGTSPVYSALHCSKRSRQPQPTGGSGAGMYVGFFGGGEGGWEDCGPVADTQSQITPHSVQKRLSSSSSSRAQNSQLFLGYKLVGCHYWGLGAGRRAVRCCTHEHRRGWPEAEHIPAVLLLSCPACTRCIGHMCTA
jgi:hypothetical protein